MQFNPSDDRLDFKSFNVQSFMDRFGRDVVRAIGKSEQGLDDDKSSITPIRIQQSIIKEKEDCLVMVISDYNRKFVVKAFDYKIPNSDWRLDREVNMLLSLRNLDMTPSLIAYQEADKYFIMKYVEGETLESILSIENLEHVAHRLGTWFRVMTSHTPFQKKASNWKNYLSKYENILPPLSSDESDFLSKNFPIQRFTPSKNDAFLGNFIVREKDRRLIGIDFEATTLKPVGWDLLVMARSLVRRYPKHANIIASNLVAGWGSEIDGISAKNFARLTQIFSKLTANIETFKAVNPAQDFFERYKEVNKNE